MHSARSKQTNKQRLEWLGWDGMVWDGRVWYGMVGRLGGGCTSRQVNKIANKVKMLKCQRNARYIFYIYSFADSESALASSAVAAAAPAELPPHPHPGDKSDDGRHVLTPVA